MDNEEDRKKKLPDDVPSFLRKRSESELPRYAATIRAFFEQHRKQGRAAVAKRRASDHGNERKISGNRKKGETEQKDRKAENAEHPVGEEDRVSKRRGGGDKSDVGRCRSRTRSLEPKDRCCRRRRRSCSRRRRRRRSCRRRKRRRSCRRRRRRRSCRRRRRRACRRRRRRSCSRRRRRRRSCSRRRRRR